VISLLAWLLAIYFWLIAAVWVGVALWGLSAWVRDMLRSLREWRQETVRIPPDTGATEPPRSALEQELLDELNSDAPEYTRFSSIGAEIEIELGLVEKTGLTLSELERKYGVEPAE
jgi:hypothetical protein